MEKEQFVAVETEPWWLLQADVDYRLEELRQRLGASFGWTESTWYSRTIRLEEVYDFLQQQGSTIFNQLMYELDQASSDDERQRWVESVLKLRRPGVSVADGSAPPASSPAPPVGGDSGRSVAAAPTPATSSAPRRKSAFGSKRQAEPSPARAESGARPATGVSTPGAPVRKSAFGGKRQPEPSRPAAGTEHHVPDFDEQVKTVMSALSAADISAIADEVGLSPEEVKAMIQEDDFAHLVADEQEQLAS
jgi:hypothetical protein